MYKSALFCFHCLVVVDCRLRNQTKILKNTVFRPNIQRITLFYNSTTNQQQSVKRHKTSTNVWKIGVNFSSEKRTVDEWKIETT